MITYEILNNLLKPIVSLLQDKDIQEIMINAWDNVWIEKAGLMTKTDKKIDEKTLSNAIMVMNFANNKEGRGSPIIEGTLPDGSRVGGALPPVSKTACLSIRKFTKVKKDLDDYAVLNESESLSLSEAKQEKKDMELKEYLIKTVRSKKNIIISGGTSSGKAQPLDALILTPTGFKKLGEVEIGETVLTPSGNHVKVIGIFPQGEKDIFKVTFYDGRTVECTADHLWKVWTRTSIYSKDKKKKIRNMGWRVVELSEINKWLINNRNACERTAVPQVTPYAIELAEIFHMIPPYVLGVLIGDGTLTYSTPRISNPNYEIYKRIENEMPDYEIRQINGHPLEHLLVKRKQEKISKFRQELERLGLNGKTAAYKYIPEEYRLGSVKQRINLVQGLMDTDGYVSKDGYLSYSTASYELAKNIQEIIWSLGGIATINKKQPYFKDKDGNKKAGLMSYTVNIIHPDPLRFVSIGKKRERIKQRIRNWRLRIKKIEPAGRKPCQCIAIDGKDGLYITNNYIVTHNTTFFNVLLKYLDNNDRVITIEDIFELEVNVPNKVALRAAVYENFEITANDLVKLSLRMRPDKIILGEIRGAAGFDLMWAFNTGHSGGSTIHANSVRATLSQLEMYVLMARVDWDYKTMQMFIANNVNTIIFLDRKKVNGRDIRGIREIAEVQGIKDGDYILEKIF